MQVDPIKLTLKAPGTQHLKVKCDERLSNFAYNFNLRRYIKAVAFTFTPIFYVAVGTRK